MKNWAYTTPYIVPLVSTGLTGFGCAEPVVEVNHMPFGTLTWAIVRNTDRKTVNATISACLIYQ